MRQKTVRVNIKDVAYVAGVSTQTVSRVINDRPDVSPETRKRVKEVIQKVGYRPSALARSLISQRSYTLGVVIAGLKLTGPSNLLNGITHTAEAAGYSLILKELPSFAADEIEPIFHALLSHQVDGIIWAVSEVGENRKWLNKLQIDQKIPLVYVTMKAQSNLTVVSVDNYLGGRLAVSHLIDQGYRHIAHLAGPLEWWEARQRKQAWNDILSESDRQADDSHWIAGNWSSASGVTAIEQLFEQYPEMDSVFVANDQMALGALQVIHQRGIKVPEQMGIVGFDNIPESAYFWPPLTTIEQNQFHVAEVAVNEVVKIIESGWQGADPIEPQSIILEPTLVIRKSSDHSKDKNRKGGEGKKGN